MHIHSLLAILTGLALTSSGGAVDAVAVRQAAAPAAFDPKAATLPDFLKHANQVALDRIAKSSTNGSGCTPDKVIVRKLFENLSGTERIAYSSALLCLMKLPAKTPAALAPGVKSRYDDFIGTHVNQTESIHFTYNFLGWHRWFLWEMEQALRNECGYKGAVPYWDFSRTAKEGFKVAAITDGSATSLSGNGAPVAHAQGESLVFNAGTTFETRLPLGEGGGCIMSGPFANVTTNLGPYALFLPNNKTDSSSPRFSHNPRCIKRDLTDASVQRFANETTILELLKQPDVDNFQSLLQGRAGTPDIGAHGGGHFFIGGDPGRDMATSPGDPLFWSLHANVDRVWWMWQMLDPVTRVGNVASALSGPVVPFTKGPNGTLDDLQHVDNVKPGVQIKIGDLLDSTAGILCTVYE